MEPFFLRCETCHARLRVRDERFLGQVQSCPKCGSMVQIVAPAGWLATDETAPAPEPVEVATAALPAIGARVIALLREHAVWSSGGAATAVVVSGLVAFLALRGGEERVVALPPATPVVEEKIAAPGEEVQQDLPAAVAVETETPIVPTTSPAPIVPPPEEIEFAAAQEEPPAVSPPQIASTPVTNEKPRTLTLEPVQLEPPAETATATAKYPSAIDVEADVVDAKPQVADRLGRAARPPARVTNVDDQLSVPIESIDLPAMPIGEFVNLISGMAAVPIRLDAKVLGEVGLSTRSTVTVRGDDTTVGKLLAGVLKEHQLTCDERDGVLVVVKAKR